MGWLRKRCGGKRVFQEILWPSPFKRGFLPSFCAKNSGSAPGDMDFTFDFTGEKEFLGFFHGESLSCGSDSLSLHL